MQAEMANKRSVQDDSGGRVPGLGRLSFGMFDYPARAVGSYIQ